MEINRSPTDRIQAVLRAQGTPDPVDDLVAHLSAVEVGSEIVPAIRECLISADWSAPRPAGRLAAPVFRQRLASISRFTLDDYYDLEICGLRVLIARCLGNPHRTSRYLLHWLSGLPRGDLAGISRIYVIERTTESYWGEYLRILSKIVLVWRGGREQSIRARWATEFTLYHEVGHHVDGAASHSKTEGERNADSYALRRFSLAHPILGSGALAMIALTLILGRTPRARL